MPKITNFIISFSKSAQLLSHIQLFATWWSAAHQASLSNFIIYKLKIWKNTMNYIINLYAEHIMRNAKLNEAQAGIKIAGRNINNLRYADDTTLMAGSEEEVKASWWKWKRRVKKLVWNPTFEKLRSWHPVPSLQGKKMGKQWKQWWILFSYFPKSLQMVTAAMKLKDNSSLEEKLWPT